MSPLNIMVIGGTSGIGWALALHYLQAGHRVAVCGRDPGRIDAEAASPYPQLKRYALDIADAAAIDHALADFLPEPLPLDLLIVSAGTYFNSRHHALDADATLRLLATNVSGLHHAFECAARRLLQQPVGTQRGQLVAISSVAGLLKDYPGASLYSATKRSVLSLCETYRIALAPFSIAVTAIVPGYMDTARLRELNGGDARGKPFLLSEAAAVREITAAIARRQPVHVFPWQMRWLVAVLNRLPTGLLKRRR